jgi:hypothetical protein
MDLWTPLMDGLLMIKYHQLSSSLIKVTMYGLETQEEINTAKSIAN